MSPWLEIFLFRLWSAYESRQQKYLPYTITKMMPSPTGLPPFYQMFSMPFNSPEELQAAMDSPSMQVIAADTKIISNGSPLVVLTGNEDH